MFGDSSYVLLQSGGERAVLHQPAVRRHQVRVPAVGEGEVEEAGQFSEGNRVHNNPDWSLGQPHVSLLEIGGWACLCSEMDIQLCRVASLRRRQVAQIDKTLVEQDRTKDGLTHCARLRQSEASVMV